MRKRINRKLLDTETAKSIGTTAVDENGDIVEQLFHTKGGAYFLYQVVALPKVDNKIRTSEDIKLVSYEEAKAWAKSNLSEAEYTAAFGFEKAADNKIVNITVAVPQKVYNILKYFKSSADQSYGETITEAVMYRFGVEFPDDELDFDNDSNTATDSE